MLVHLIADFGANDLAFAEVTQAVLAQLPSAQLVSTSVGPFDTLAAGFVAAQLAAAPTPAGALMLLNVAPRRDDKGPRVDNDGERLLVAEMPSGFRVLGVDAGYSFSFLARAAERLWAVDWPTKGSQFRSRDLFPAALARLHAGTLPALAASARRAEGADRTDGAGTADSAYRANVPAIPDSCVAYVDGFGNVKTTIAWGPELAAHSGAAIEVEVAGRRHPARLAGGSFAVAEGELAVAPGSSGFPLGNDCAPLRWVELFLRGGSAAGALGLGGAAGVVTGAPVLLHLQPREAVSES